MVQPRFHPHPNPLPQAGEGAITGALSPVFGGEGWGEGVIGARLKLVTHQVLACALATIASGGFAGAAFAADAVGRTPLPTIEPATKGEQCVAEPAFMRRNHMDLLKHQRDETVFGGIRGAKYSLKECIACHASSKTGSVAKAETNFCVSCHSYTAVKIDCFECHTDKPAAKPAALAQRGSK